MAIKMVREPSDTPNITNIDDIVAMRYAYGNQNGFIKNKGTELLYTVNGLDFTINSGRFVIQGVECNIDANGVTITIDNVSSLRYFSVYAKVDLSLNDVQILTMYSSLGYPSIPESQDLTKNTNGIAYLELYRFTSSGASISNVQKIIKPIKYYGSFIVWEGKKYIGVDNPSTFIDICSIPSNNPKHLKFEISYFLNDSLYVTKYFEGMVFQNKGRVSFPIATNYSSDGNLYVTHDTFCVAIKDGYIQANSFMFKHYASTDSSSVEESSWYITKIFEIID